MKVEDTTKASGQVLADLLGITRRQISNLARDEILTKDIKGRFNLSDSIQAYLSYSKKEGGPRNRLYEAQAQKYELEVAEKRGEIANTSDFMFALMDIFSVIANQLDAIGGRSANELASISDPGIVRQKLLKETREIRKECAAKIVKLADNWQSSKKVNIDSGATAKPNTKPVGRAKKKTTTRKRRTGAVSNK